MLPALAAVPQLECIVRRCRSAYTLLSSEIDLVKLEYLCAILNKSCRSLVSSSKVKRVFFDLIP
jgi:hypothetical protein